MRRAILVLLALYLSGYVGFRQTQVEVWAKDKNAYVMFADSAAGEALCYLWRPLSYVDGALTGMRFHIGPHR